MKLIGFVVLAIVAALGIAAGLGLLDAIHDETVDRARKGGL